MNNVYLGDFVSKKDLESNFEITLSDDIKILLAVYELDHYEGSAFVLFTENGKLFEVNGSHCSCYGLENQFIPEETTLASLKYTLANGYKFNGYKAEIEEAFQRYERGEF